MQALGNLSGFSFYGSLWMPEDLVRAARAAGYTCVGLADWGGFRGAVAFSQACRREEMQPVHGVRLGCRETGPDLLCVPCTAQAYGLLSSWLTTQWSDNQDASGSRRTGLWAEALFPYAAWREFWQAHGRHFLLALPIDGGSPGRCKESVFTRRLEAFRALGHPDRLWLEIAWHDGESRLFQRRMHDRLHPGWSRWVATTASRWRSAEDAEAFRILQSIGTLTLHGQEHPEKVRPGSYTLPTAESFAGRFRSAPHILASTAAFAREAQFDFSFGQLHLPHWRDQEPQGNVLTEPKGASASKPARERSAAELRYRVLRGLVRRYRKYPWGTPPSRRELLERLNRELAVVNETGYAGYFLIFHDIVRECRRRGIPLLARGSAAGSLLCHALGVSNVCPFRFGLCFERFLNIGRLKAGKLPDIDLDLPWDRRDEIISWLYERHPPGHAAMIGGYATFKGRAAIAEVARCLGLPETEARRWTKALPHGGLGKFLRRPDHYAEAAEIRRDPRFAQVCAIAARLDGLPRHPMMHPCGMVIADDPLTRFSPLVPSAKGFLMTQMDMDAVEDLGLLKLDLLGQAGLSVIRDCIAAVRRESPLPHSSAPARCGDGGAGGQIRIGGALPDARPATFSANPLSISPERLEDLALPDLDYGDATVYERIRRGDVRGVFHIESPAMVGLLRLCQCADIDCLLATVSVIRPGAANENKKRQFALRHLGLEAPEYAHPSLEPLLRDTYGLMVYEEHILTVAHHFAGLDWNQADALRRLLVKEREGAPLAAMQREFVLSALNQGHSLADAERVWDLLAAFRGYMFNKAHGAAYGIEAYTGAWLAQHHPLHFYAAVLQNRRGFYAPLVYMLEILLHGGGFRLPEVNDPEDAFRVLGTETPDDVAEVHMVGKLAEPATSGKTVAIPLWQIRGLSDLFLARRRRALQTQGAFRNWEDFLFRTHPAPADLLLLARAGALRRFFPNRHIAVWQAHNYEPANYAPEASADFWGQLCVASEGSPYCPRPLPAVMAQWEVELLGFPVSQTPFEHWLSGIDTTGTIPAAQLGQFVGGEADICGLLVCTRHHTTLKGQPMKFMSLADPSGISEITLFPPAYRRFASLTARYSAFRARVKVQPEATGRSYNLDCLELSGPDGGHRCNPYAEAFACGAEE